MARRLRRVAWAAGVVMGTAWGSGCETTQAETRPTPSDQQAQDPAPVRGYDAKAIARAMRGVDALLARGDSRQKDAWVMGLALEPSSPAARFIDAYKIDDRRAAWRELDAIRKQLPGLALGYVGIQAIYVEWKLDQEAQRAYEAAIKIDPTMAVAHARMGNLMLAREDAEKANAYFDLALAQDPEDADALYGKARLARMAGNNDEALKLLERTAAAWPEHLAPVRDRAELLESMGRRKEAAQVFLAAARLDRRPYETLMHAAALLAQDGDRTGAEQVYAQALTHNPNDPTLLATLGKLAAERGDAETQRAYFARAVEGRPDDLEMQRTLAEAYLAKGELAGAERHYLEVVRLKPEDQPGHLALARMYAAMPKYREAMEHYDMALAAGALDEASAKEREELATKLMLPTTPASGRDVNRVFATALKTIISAYEARLKEAPSLKGDVTVEVEVGEDGQVVSARLRDDTLKDDILLANIYFTIKGAQFPKGKKARYSYPISFTGTGPVKGK